MRFHAHLGRVDVQYWGANVATRWRFRPSDQDAHGQRSADGFDLGNRLSETIPSGRNLVGAADVYREFARYRDLRVRFVGLAGLVRILVASRARRAIRARVASKDTAAGAISVDGGADC